MKQENLEIPINEAKKIAKKFNKEQVVILGFNKWSGYHLTTYGNDEKNCKEAALAGEFVKKAIGGNWQDSEKKDIL